MSNLKTLSAGFFALLLVLSWRAEAAAQQPQPTPQATPKPQATPTATPQPTPMPLPQATPTPSPSPTPAAAQPQQATFTSEPLALETPTGKLFGTLTLPKGAGPFPVALIISGSGPTDRDGNTLVIPGANNSLKMLAEGLAERGVASLRYDKRGIGESAKSNASEADLRFDTFIDDAVAWGRQLRNDKRFSSLVVVGHSEGSLIGMVAAQKLGAEGYVSIAGPGRPIDQTILDQLRAGAPPDLVSRSEAILKGLAEGKTTEDVPAPLAPIFRPSAQPFLISWIKYDPAKEVAKISAPVLIVQGTTDVQIAVSDAQLLAKGKPSARLLLVEGMNHVLKEVPVERDRQIKSYGDPTLPVVPKLVGEIADFVKGIKKQ